MGQRGLKVDRRSHLAAAVAPSPARVVSVGRHHPAVRTQRSTPWVESASGLPLNRATTMQPDRSERAADDPRVLSDLPDASEPKLLEKLDGPAEEEAPLGFPARGRL